MSRQYNIRWSKADNQELAKVVRNFNSKISRLEKKNPELKNALPERASVRQLKELVQTRQDLKREINMLRRFSKRGSEEIVTHGDNNISMTKWQRTEINRFAAIANRKREKRRRFIESLEVTQDGEGLGYTKGDIGMGRAEVVSLAPIEGLTKSMGQRDLQMRFEGLRAEAQTYYYREKDYRARENYIRGLLENFALSDVADIVREIEAMPIDEFIKKFYSEADANFEGLYAPDREQYQEYVEDLKSTWLTEKGEKFKAGDNIEIQLYVKNKKVESFSNSSDALEFIRARGEDGRPAFKSHEISYRFRAKK